MILSYEGIYLRRLGRLFVWSIDLHLGTFEVSIAVSREFFTLCSCTALLTFGPALSRKSLTVSI